MAIKRIPETLNKQWSATDEEKPFEKIFKNQMMTRHVERQANRIVAAFLGCLVGAAAGHFSLIAAIVAVAVFAAAAVHYVARYVRLVSDGKKYDKEYEIQMRDVSAFVNAKSKPMA